MPKVVKPYCSRCGKHLSPAWKSKCEHCKAPFTAFPPEFRTEIVAPGDEIEAPRPTDWGRDIGLDAIIWFATHVVGDVRRAIRRRRADRHGIWLGAEVVDGGSGQIRIRVDNRRATPVLVTAIGLTRYRDPAAAYRMPRSDALPPGGSIEVMLDSARAVTAAPIKERIFNRDLDHVFVEIDHEPERISDLLPSDVRRLLQGRRGRYVRLGRP